MQIRIFQIKVNPGRREADPEAVHDLAESISKVGLLNPITVDQDYTLIAGLHRLEAAKMLGWSEIECTVSDLDGLLAQLAEIDENLIRRGLDRVQEWDQLARRKEIYEMLHPETRNGVSQAIAMNVAQGNNVNAPGAFTSKSFVSDTAEKLGVSKRTIEENLQLAKDLTPATKKIIQNTDEKIKKKDMLKLSRLVPEQQEEAANQLAMGKIHSVDEYQPDPAKLEGVTSGQDDLQGEEQAESVSAPPIPISVLPASGGYFATTKDSVDDLKNPDKDRSRTPDTFFASFSFFLERFCQGITNYSSPEYTTVFPLLTQEQLDQIRQQVDFSCTALHTLFHKMERKSQT